MNLGPFLPGNIALVAHLIVTVFLCLLFGVLYRLHNRTGFFRYWTFAWAALAVFQTGQLVLSGVTRPFYVGSWNAVALSAGFLEIVFLFLGVRSFANSGHRNARRARTSVFFAVGISLGLMLLYALSTSTITRDLLMTVPLRLALGAVYLYAAFVLLKRPHVTSRPVAAITGLACLLLALNQAVFVLFSFSALSEFQLLSNGPNVSSLVLVRLVEIIGKLAIALGMVLILLRSWSVAEANRITEARRKEEAESRYKKLVEQLGAVTYVAHLGAEGEWEFVSPQIQSMLGYSPEEWLAASPRWHRLLHPDDRDTVMAAEVAAAAGKPFSAEYRIRKRDGEIVWVHDTGTVARGEDREPLIRGVMVDVTVQKQMDSRFLQSQKMEAIGTLAGGVAHDFNNLLTAIDGFCALALQDARDSDKLCRDIASVQRASQKAAALTRQLLAFSRKQVLQPRVISLNESVREMELILRRSLGEHVDLTIHLTEDLGSVRADPIQIEQVILNLAVNARDAMPQGGKLVLETANADLDEAYALMHEPVIPGHYVMLAVSDSGTGMDTITREHIFEPFFTTKEFGSGTGLGLSTVYGIVKQSRGYIWVYSEPGKGSTFRIYLPRVDVPAETVATETPPATAVQSSRASILLVEDDSAVRELLQEVLTSRGYRVSAAGSAEQAEELLDRSQGFDLLLTDVVMPGMDGPQLARRVANRFPHIRILFMSGYTQNHIAHQGILEQGVELLQKPFTPDSLVARVEQVLSSTKAN